MLALMFIIGLSVGALLMSIYAFIIHPWRKRKKRTCSECAEFRCKRFNYYTCDGGRSPYNLATKSEKESGHLEACSNFVDAYDRHVALQLREQFDAYRE